MVTFRERCSLKFSPSLKNKDSTSGWLEATAICGRIAPRVESATEKCLATWAIIRRELTSRFGGLVMTLPWLVQRSGQPVETSKALACCNSRNLGCCEQIITHFRTIAHPPIGPIERFVHSVTASESGQGDFGSKCEIIQTQYGRCTHSLGEVRL